MTSVHALRRSPFVEIGNDGLTDGAGLPVTPVYRSDDAQVLVVSSALAEVLRHDPIDSTRLTPGLRDDLVRHRLICDDVDRIRREHHQSLAQEVNAGRHRVLTLMPTSYCNMGCDYCGQKHVRGVTGARHRDRIVDRVHAVADQPETRSLDVRWFGGEPLMAFAIIRSLSQAFLPRLDRAGIGYTSKIVTNGALLDDRKLRVLRDDCRIGTFNITIDGPQRVHDLHRPLKSGHGSFSKILGVLQRAVDDTAFDDTTFLLRTNVDVNNCEYVDEYLHLMASAGLAHRPNVVFDLHEIHPWGNDVEALRVDRQHYAQRETAWMRLMDDLGLTYSRIPNQTRPRVCSAVTTDAEIIDPRGGVFSCTEHPLVPGDQDTEVLVSVDDLRPQDRRPAGRFDIWPAEVAAGQRPCSACSLLPVCGGQCPKAWNEGETACPSIRFNLRDRLTLHARAHRPDLRESTDADQTAPAPRRVTTP